MTLTLGERLRAFRHDKEGRMRVSALELAKEMGWTCASQITRREKGQIAMTEAELLEICAGVARILERREKARTPAKLLDESSMDR